MIRPKKKPAGDNIETTLDLAVPSQTLPSPKKSNPPTEGADGAQSGEPGAAEEEVVEETTILRLAPRSIKEVAVNVEDPQNIISLPLDTLSSHEVKLAVSLVNQLARNQSPAGMTKPLPTPSWSSLESFLFCLNGDDFLCFETPPVLFPSTADLPGTTIGVFVTASDTLQFSASKPATPSKKLLVLTCLQMIELLDKSTS